MATEKIGVVLSGGGALGAFQAGAIQYLHEQGLKPDYVFGISVGALNGAMWQQDKVESLVDIWKTITKKNVFSGPVWWNVLRGKMGLYSNEPLRKLIDKYVVIKDFVRRFHCGAVDLHWGTYERFFPHLDGEFKKGLLASTSIPVWHTPVEIGDHLFVDGGVRNPTPIGDVLAALPKIDRLIIINCEPFDMGRGWTGPKKPWALKMIEIAQRVLGIMYEEIYHNDINTFLTINKLINTVGRSVGGYRFIPYTLIAPERFLGSGMDFDRQKLDALFTEGYDRAAEQFTS